MKRNRTYQPNAAQSSTPTPSRGTGVPPVSTPSTSSPSPFFSPSPSSSSSPRARRGNVIILAVGALAVLAVVALSYSATVRVERAGALRAAQPPDGAAAAKIVADEIAAILTADLFGNKIVTPDVPRFLNPALPHSQNNPRVWPAAFEDGDFADYPFTITDPNSADFSYNDGGPFDGVPGPHARLEPYTRTAAGTTRGYYRAALPDNAWLASSEPFFDPTLDAALNQSYWPQVTNLRSAYRWRPINPAIPAQTFWIRDDGRFADLGQWFVQRIQRPDGRWYANPEAEISFGDGNAAWTDPLTNNQFNSGPRLGVHNYDNANNSPTRVFGVQMNGMHERTFGAEATARTITGAPSHADTRYWADTDGDLRPDARWQEIETLRGYLGLRWTVATRIVDNSALVNVNTAMEFGRFDPPTWWSNDQRIGIGNGATPSDVDLLRLLRDARLNAENPNNNGAWAGVIDVADYTNYSNLLAWEKHLAFGRNVRDFVSSYNAYQSVDNTAQYGWGVTLTSELLSQHFTNDRYYLRAHRAAAWTFFSSTLDPLSSFTRRYGLDSEIALRTYWASNDDRVVSDLETRLDFRFLPGDDSTNVNSPLNNPPQNHIGGPLRTSRATTVERSYEPISYLGGTAYKRPTTHDVRDDTRRLLTTVSGVSDISPIPVLNPAMDNSVNPPRPVFDRFVNRKVRLADFAAPRSNTHRAELIRDAFEAFVWALAPFATDQPLWRFSQTDQLPPRAESRYHYGGGQQSPAAWYGATSLGEPNAAYAVLRAASLAVNLAAASDPDPLAAPIVARLFNVQEREPNAPSPAGVVNLGARFSHGDIPAASLPVDYVGDAPNGVTLVALGRQPFLREVYTMAVYQDKAVGPVGSMMGGDYPLLANNVMDPLDEDEHLGSILAVEIGNPWPNPIVLNNHRIIMIDENDAQIILDLSAANGRVMTPGQRLLLWSATHPDETTNEERFDHWDALEIEWIDQVATKFGMPSGANQSEFMQRLPLGALHSPTIGTTVIFQDFIAPARGATVLLTRFIGGNEYVIDRMSPDPSHNNAVEPFPAKMDAAFNFQAFVGVCSGAPAPGLMRGAGRVSIISTLRRPTEPPDPLPPSNPTGVGFPAYVLERPENNTVAFYDGRTDLSGRYDGANARFWRLPMTIGPPIQPCFEDVSDPLLPGTAIPPHDHQASNGEDITLLGREKRGGTDAQGRELAALIPSFQFLAPGGPLLSTSELFSISAFAHTYVHNSSAAPSIVSAKDPELRGPGAWRTVSEQLADDANLYYNTQNTPSNPWFGVLDPSRFVLHQNNNNAGLLGPDATVRDHVAIPLAARVLDVFEGMASATKDGLTPGRINVNTAPLRVLRTLPFISPEAPIDTTGFAGGIAETPAAAYAGSDRAWLMLDYRDTKSDFIGVNGRGGTINIPGLRERGHSASSRAVRGFVSVGELPLLARWSADVNSVGVPGDFTTGTQYFHFAEVAIGDTDGTRINSGLRTSPAPNANNIGEVDGLLDLRPNAVASIDGNRAYDPVDDAEERMAIFRAVSNIVSTRSDVFTAWFIVRAYDPADIAAIRVDQPNPDANQIAEYMEQLPVAHESRWLAVFDRSNVTSPIDRPRLLLLTRLP